jgi:hypothetical protein
MPFSYITTVEEKEDECIYDLNEEHCQKWNETDIFNATPMLWNDVDSLDRLCLYLVPVSSASDPIANCFWYALNALFNPDQ